MRWTNLPKSSANWARVDKADDSEVLRGFNYFIDKNKGMLSFNQITLSTKEKKIMGLP